MPLKHGKKNMGYNIEELMKAGHSQDQAVAISYSILGEKKKKRKKK